MIARLAALALALLSTACVVTQSSQGPDETPLIRSTAPERMWRVVANDEVVGSVVLFGTGADRFFSVRNEWSQDVGMIDERGRAWAFRPHAEEAEWLGSGTIATGASRILGLEPEGELLEVPLGPAELRAGLE